MKYKKYQYTGPVYYFGNKMSPKSNLYTTATSIKEARRNFLYRVANGDIVTRYDIVDDFIKEVVPIEEPVEEPKVSHKCDRCGYTLTDMGECPVCDFGEIDLLDDFVD